MSSVLVVATSGAGGDLQPLVAAGLALRSRGHDVSFVGDGSVERALRGLNVPTEILPPEFDLGPRLVAAIRTAMASSDGDPVVAGSIVRDGMTAWARDVAKPVAATVRERTPAAIVTSLFGVEAMQLVPPDCPGGVVNSTFYLGPGPPSPPPRACGPR